MSAAPLSMHGETAGTPNITDIVPRHALARIAPGAWARALAERPDCVGDRLVAGWAAQGWPLVGRRRLPSDPPDGVPLGLPLPPSCGKRRLAFCLPRGAILAVGPPPTLAGVAVNSAWASTAAGIARLAADYDTLPRVFGSFAWAALTGLPYVGPSSDLDLLWPMIPDIMPLLDALATLEARAPGRIDGEVVTRDGDGVQWRELRDGADQILVKTGDGVVLRDRMRVLRAAA